MRYGHWQILFAALLVVLAVGLYWIQFTLFGDSRLFLESFLGYLAFLPLQVVLVSLVIERILRQRDRRAMLQKLNMVIGAFYSEVGGVLLRQLAAFDTEKGSAYDKLWVRSDWSRRQFLISIRVFRAYPWKLDSRKADLVALRALLVSRRAFMLGLLENPNLLEHATFSELLWAVFHLTEELEARPGLDGLPESDSLHLSHDMVRAYRLVVAEWLAYMQHLSQEYPYLFSLHYF